MQPQQLKKCPMCAEQIPADAVICPFCETRFGEEVETSTTTSQPVTPTLAAVTLQVRKRYTGFWIGGVLSLVLILGAIGALLWTQRANISLLSGLFATPSPTLTPTSPPTSTATLKPTITPTPLPTWVTEFAQPILDAIADRPPDFYDDFGIGSAGWKAEDWCGRRMEYVEGEMVVTDCRLSRPNINYSDFVIEFDGRFFPGADSNSTWVLDFRNIGGPNNAIRLNFNGDVSLAFFEGESYEFSGAAKSGDLWNHFLIIAKGAEIAIYINDSPLLYVPDTYLRYGDFLFIADGSILGIDNVSIWNIYDVP
ncbi:MAG: zinc ribbon domain-containing protein [Chloroflexota bacterium]